MSEVVQVLKKSQKQNLEKLINEACKNGELLKDNFKFEEVETPSRNSGRPTQVITYKGTPYKFEIFLQKNNHLAIRKPGQELPEERRLNPSVSGLYAYFEQWLRLLKQEVSIVDRPKVKSSVILKAKKVLETSTLGLSSFRVIEPGDDEKALATKELFRIEYLEDENFYFRLIENYGSPPLKITYSPGEVRVTEEEQIMSISGDFEFSLRKWAANVYKELLDSTSFDLLKNEIRVEVNEYIEKTIGKNDRSFSDEEIESFRAKIDLLSKEVEKVKEKINIKEAEIRELNSQLKTIKNDLPNFKRKAAARMVFDKMSGVILEQGKEFLKDAKIRSLLIKWFSKMIGQLLSNEPAIESEAENMIENIASVCGTTTHEIVDTTTDEEE